MKQTRIVITKDGEKITEGYFLTLKQLKKLTNDYSYMNNIWRKKKMNQKKFIEDWIKNNEDEKYNK